MLGESPLTSTLVQSTAPGAPTGLSSSDWSTSGFDVTWVAPTVGVGEEALTGYTLYERVTYSMVDLAASSGVPSSALQTMLSEDTDTVVVDTVAYDGSSSTAVSTSLSGLRGGVSYDYVVAARSAAGEGERSTALSVSTSPPAPGSLDSVSQTTSSITLSWSAPAVTTGSAVTGYNVYIDDGSSGTPGSVPVSCGGFCAVHDVHSKRLDGWRELQLRSQCIEHDRGERQEQRVCYVNSTSGSCGQHDVQLGDDDEHGLGVDCAERRDADWLHRVPRRRRFGDAVDCGVRG